MSAQNSTNILLHEDTYARGDKIARRKNCTETFLHELIFCLIFNVLFLIIFFTITVTPNPWLVIFIYFLLLLLTLTLILGRKLFFNNFLKVL